MINDQLGSRVAPVQHRRDVASLAERLTADYADLLAPGAVMRCVSRVAADMWDATAGHATLRDIERRARTRLEARLTTGRWTASEGSG